jgi:hypothetical protein
MAMPVPERLLDAVMVEAEQRVRGLRVRLWRPLAREVLGTVLMRAGFTIDHDPDSGRERLVGPWGDPL